MRHHSPPSYFSKERIANWLPVTEFKEQWKRAARPEESSAMLYFAVVITLHVEGVVLPAGRVSATV
jgi:hypothetical protein